MKYMGSKRLMLKNGLGNLILKHGEHARRIVDLFCGSGAIAWFAAENLHRPVLAIDLQTYAIVLSRAVIGRDKPEDAAYLTETWVEQAERERIKSKLWPCAAQLDSEYVDIKLWVNRARELCTNPSTIGPVWHAYGGHYFSPTQALTIDCLLKCLPQHEPQKTTCLAALISAASKCAASPGHTAQPFQPTETAGLYIQEAWRRDPLTLCKNTLLDICPRHAQVVGEAIVADAIECASTLNHDDLVIVDPPYSSVHYSRFYHVLETIALGHCGEPQGIGRYPPIDERPQSDFSRKGRSVQALSNLLQQLSQVGSTVIFTFPEGRCSNGLSGSMVIDLARPYFAVGEQLVQGRFSTLGGNNSHRQARLPSRELILLLNPL